MASDPHEYPLSSLAGRGAKELFRTERTECTEKNKSGDTKDTKDTKEKTRE
jgi:hypothetical protein